MSEEKQGPTLLPCSSSKAKKYVIIYRDFYSFDEDGKYRCKGKIVCIECDSLLDSSVKKLPTFIHVLSRPEGHHRTLGMSCICVGGNGKTTRPAMYLFGGFYSPGGKSGPEEDNDYILNISYGYDLHNLPRQVGSIYPCEDMAAKMYLPLLVEAGDDCVYALNYGKIGDGCRTENKWTLLGEQVVDIIGRCDPELNFCQKLRRLPHVVIGRKLHISLGHSSFTFDTVNRTWKTCKLFKTFWSEQNKKKSGLYPCDFFKTNYLYVSLDHATEKRKRNKLAGGPPFGFHGRGVLWDKNILLGVHYAKNCPLVAFLLDRKRRVVKGQRITLNDLDMDSGHLHDWARIVDLGRDGCFCLVHTRFDFVEVDGEIYEYGCIRTLKMELVTFRLWKIAHDVDDEEDFLGCEVLRKDVMEGCLPDNDRHYDAFCV